MKILALALMLAFWGGEAAADCLPGYSAKVAALSARAQGLKANAITFAGADSVVAAVSGPAAWVGDGALAISSGVYFAWERHEAHVFQEAQDLIEQAVAGHGDRLEKAYSKLRRKDRSLRLEDVATVIARGNEDGLFCPNDGKVLFKEGRILKFARRELRVKIAGD